MKLHAAASRLLIFALASAGLSQPLSAATFAVSGGEWHDAPGGTECYGKEITVTVSGLEPASYTVEVDAAERYFNAPGKRVMSVKADDQVLAKEVDLFKEDGPGKTRALRGTVTHANDSLAGPLRITLSGIVENATFDRIRILDAAGKVVAETSAAKLRGAASTFGAEIPSVAGPEIWKDSSRPAAERAADLVRRLSLQEKAAQLQMAAPAIPRLGIPAYDWWNEALHGVARAGVATVFPQAIGVAATWDPDLWKEAAVAIGTEARAKHHDYARTHGGATARYYGLDIWSPNVNIFRDPRWGRGQETYGEDPFLTARMGVAFVQGLQGNDPNYFRVIATPKHFAVHSGPEADRHHFDVNVSDQDLWETYLPAFEACILEGGAYSAMGAYNRFRGESCSASKLLLGDILRGKWGFQGFTVSDVDSVSDIHAHHHITHTPEESSALALKRGLDLNSGSTYRALPEAVQAGLCSLEDVDRAAKRCFTARFRLGMFDSPDRVPYARIPITANDTPAHDALALKVARESIVLLKNEGSLLPLPKKGVIAMIGPDADGSAKDGVLVGNYNGEPSHPVGLLDGMRKKLQGAGTVLYAKGCEVTRADPKLEAEALAVAARADVLVMVMGLNPHIEGEEGAGGDRTDIALPAPQEALMEKLAALGKPAVLVLAAGSAQAVCWAQEHVPAILDVWYPGQRGGDALADVLFGDCNPAGRLPVTFYRSDADLPDFKNYDMAGRTYRYFAGKPLYPFGFGLSYTTFRYSKPRLAADSAGGRNVTVQVANTGRRAGDEVVELYVSRPDRVAADGLPIRSLRGFKRVALAPGEAKEVTFRLTPFQFAFVDKAGQRTVEPGTYRLGIGGSQEPAISLDITFGKRIVEPPYAVLPPSCQ